jgi:hypothetical protein
MNIAVLLSLASTGCAVGYGVGYKSRSIGVGDERSTLTYENSRANFNGYYHELRIIDTTGLLLAAMVNAGKAQAARDEAIEKAAYKTPDQDGTVTVEVSYEPMPILSGLLTDLRFRFGLGQTNLEVPEGTMPSGDVSWWEFDLRPEFYTFRPVKSLPMVSALFLGMIASKGDTDVMGNVDRELRPFSMDLTAGGSLSYVVTPNLVATGRVAIGFISPLIGGLVGGDLLHPSAEIEVGWRPFSSEKVGVMLGGSAQIAKEWALTRSMTTTRIGLNATVTFGMQTPKSTRKPEEPTTPETVPTTAANGLPPDSVCKDPQSPCRAIELNAPPEVKAAFVECARVSIEADRTGNAGDQPATCRRNANTIQGYYKANEATLTPEMKKLVDVAAASSYHLANVGYGVTAGAKSADQCAMLEQMYTHVVRSIPEQIATVNASVDECRTQWTCTTGADGDMTCAAKTP